MHSACIHPIDSAVQLQMYHHFQCLHGDISFHTVLIVINDQPPRAGRRFSQLQPTFLDDFGTAAAIHCTLLLLAISSLTFFVVLQFSSL